MKTKKAYTTCGWIFESKDLAIICGNTSAPIEINIPGYAQTIGGKISIDGYSHKKAIMVIELDDNFDHTDCVDYMPIIEFEFNSSTDEDSFERKVKINELESHEMIKCNFKIEDLSKELKTKIIEDLNTILDSNY